MGKKTLLCLALGAWLFSGCDGDGGSSDAGSDDDGGVTPVDGGPAIDDGGGDAGTSPDDAGARTDGAAPDDAGLPADADTPASDGGLADGGAADGGAGPRGWQLGYDLTGRALVSDVTELASGDLVAVGATTAFGEGAIDGLVLCTSADGTYRWSRALGGDLGDQLRAVSADSAGGAMVAGTTEINVGFGLAEQRAMIARYDGAGALLWQRVLAPNGDPADVHLSLYAIAALGGGEHAVVGEYRSPTTGSAGWVGVVDEDGELLRQSAYQSPFGGGIGLRAIVAIPGDGLLTVGARSTSAIAIRLDDDLGVRWISSQPSPSASFFVRAEATRVHALPSGGFLVGGFHEETVNQFDWWVGRLDAAGAGVWSRWLDTDPGANNLAALVPWGTDEILAVGFRSADPTDAYAVRLGLDGFIRSQHELGLTGEDGPLGGRLAADGALLLAGTELVSSSEAYLSPELMRVGPDDPLVACEAAAGTAFRSASLDSANLVEMPADYEVSRTVVVSTRTVSSTPGPSSVTGETLCPSP